MLKYIQLVVFLNTLLSLTSFKINNYVGSGYNIFKGNPKSKSGKDDGFGLRIFNITYTKGQKTSDGYAVPDFVEYAETNSYDFTVTQKEYTGMTSYQKELNVYASVNYNSLTMKGKFSLNTDYQTMEDTTETSIVTESTAKCELYTLQINSFDDPPISSTFQKAILMTITDQSQWTKIFDVYGTHYIEKTSVGGRASMQYKMTTKDYQEMTALGVDTKASASYSMVSATGSSSVDETRLSVFTSKTVALSKIYIGGSPPSDGNFVSWSNSVSSNPSPVLYQLGQLSDLFTTTYFPTLNSSSLSLLKTNYGKAITSYCQARNCSEPSADAPLPNPITTTAYFSTTNGGSGGSSFSDSYPKNTLLRVKKVIIRSGKKLDGLQFMLSDGVNTLLTPWHGGTGGGSGSFEVPDGQYIKTIELQTGKYVYRIKFTTDAGVQSDWFGGNDGSYKYVSIDGQYLVGLTGRSGKVIDSIGFISNKVNY